MRSVLVRELPRTSVCVRGSGGKAKAVITALRDEGFDVVALAVETPFVAVARDAKKRVLAGDRVRVLKGVEQFVLYTGMRPDVEQTAAAARAAAG